MRRMMLLALLALALPTAALANSISSTDSAITIPYDCPTSGNCRIFTGHPDYKSIREPFRLTLIGTTAGSGIVISGIHLSPNPCGPAITLCTFTGGVIAVEQAGVTHDFPIVSGAFTINGDARTATGFHVNLEDHGTVDIVNFAWNGNGHVDTAGSIHVIETSLSPRTRHA